MRSVNDGESGKYQFLWVPRFLNFGWFPAAPSLMDNTVWTYKLEKFQLEKSKKSFINCSRHRNLQNIWNRILQIFCYDLFMILRYTIWGALEKNITFGFRKSCVIPERFALLLIKQKKSQQKIWRIRIWIFWRFRCRKQVT